MSRMAQAAATVFGVGYLRPGPGTWGSAAALPMFWALHQLGGPALVILSVGAIFVLGVWATTNVTQGRKDHDPSEIVIDEVAGQLIALTPLSLAAARLDLPILALWPGWIAAFLSFRLFDIWKPGPVGWADRRHDPVGVMLDDVIAGILAAFSVLLLAALWHGVIA
jgi:phosphatidylglycerophosphatase A